jgi:glycosyltransferase involved in cell wall biosynthesis
MRILSVVTLITPDGAYGGPVRVAINQAAALTELGHEVTLTAAVRGFSEPPTEMNGVPIRLFPARTLLPGTGFAGLAAPGMLRWLRTAISEFDVAHIHAARDLVTLPAAAIARRAKLPYFLQTHGMIDPSANPLAGPLDAILTRPLLRAAAGVFHLTALEREQLQAVAGDLRFHQLANGVPMAEGPPPPDEMIEVLYLARLAPRKRPLAFVEAAMALAEEFGAVQFTLIGPDEGEGPAVRAAIKRATDAGVNITWTGALAPDQTLQRMRAATVYVLPSVDEPYPMSVLEALSVGRPVVITDTCGLADFVTQHDAGLVCNDSLTDLTRAIGALLGDPGAAAARGARGQAAVRSELSMAAISDQLAGHYLTALSS